MIRVMSIFLTTVLYLVSIFAVSNTTFATCLEDGEQFLASPKSNLHFHKNLSKETYSYDDKNLEYSLMYATKSLQFTIGGLEEFQYYDIAQTTVTIMKNGERKRTSETKKVLPRVFHVGEKKIFALDHQTAFSETPSQNFYRAISFYKLIKKEVPLVQDTFLPKKRSPFLDALHSPSILQNQSWQVIFRKYPHPEGGYDVEANNFVPLSSTKSYLAQLTKNGTNVIQKLEKEEPISNMRQYLFQLHKELMSDNYTGYYQGTSASFKEASSVLNYLTDVSNKIPVLPIPYYLPTSHLPPRYDVVLPLHVGRTTNFGGKRLEHYYLNSEDHSGAIKAISSLFKKLKSAKTSDREYLTSLSDLYHIGANAHLFVRGNNSLFFAIVNYFLMTRGLNPVSHGELDYMAMLYSFDEFRYLFFKHIASSNPELESVINPKINQYLDFLGLVRTL